MITTGIVAFSNLTETEMYNGQDTGKYSIVLSIDTEEASKLEGAGVPVREYKNQPQRKFVTKFDTFDVVDIDNEPISKHIRYGSKVKVMWDPSKPHPQHGCAPYLKKIKVLEVPEGAQGEEDPDF